MIGCVVLPVHPKLLYTRNRTEISKNMIAEYSDNYSAEEKTTIEQDWTRVSGALQALATMYPDVPKTGDDSHFALWLALFVLSVGALVVRKRRRV